MRRRLRRSMRCAATAAGGSLPAHNARARVVCSCPVVRIAVHDCTNSHPQRTLSQELEAMKNKVKEMEDEAEKLRKIQEQVEEQMGGAPPPPPLSTHCSLPCLLLGRIARDRVLTVEECARASVPLALHRSLTNHATRCRICRGWRGERGSRWPLGLRGQRALPPWIWPAYFGPQRDWETREREPTLGSTPKTHREPIIFCRWTTLQRQRSSRSTLRLAGRSTG